MSSSSSTREKKSAAPGKYLIVNADDFGMSLGINEGIVTAHEEGIVTSASLMVRWPAAAAAAAFGRDHPTLSLGLHLDLGECIFRNGKLRLLYEVVNPDDSAAVAGELARQLNHFRVLVGRDPTHLDSHQHVHCWEPVRSIAVEAACRLSIPLRHCSSARYCGEFYGQADDGAPLPGAIRLDRLIEIVTGLRPGFTELVCHPGFGDDIDAVYRDERSQELAVLCDPRIRETLAATGVELCSFRGIAALGEAVIR
jgi:chitin disaccharide deacetylase